MILTLEDLKTGRMEIDNEFERHSNVCGLKARYPDAKVIYWVYYYPRSGNRPTWKYEWEGDTLTITGPDGDTEVHDLTVDPQPLLNYVKDRIAEMEATAPDPTPGEHCESWFGQPCYFLGNGCPIEESTLTAAVTTSSMVPSTEAEILSAPEEDRPGLAFLALKNGMEPTPKLAGLAWSGCQQLKGGAKLMEEKIKSWTEETGQSFKSGKTTYGMRDFSTVVEVDDVLAISLMLMNGFTAKDIAKAVNISKSSLDKGISKRKWKDVKDEIMDTIQSQVSKKKKFGKIK